MTARDGAGGVNGPVNDPVKGTVNGARPASASGRAGLVTSPHGLASAAGRDVLRQGGNAIEAAIAIAAVLCVTMPHFTGLGGDGFWLLADGASGDAAPLAISGIGQAARDLPPGLSNGDPIPVRGPACALTSAATVAAWEAAYRVSREQWGGTLSWASLLAPAIAAADDGFATSRSQDFWYTYRAAEMVDASIWHGFARTFLPEGRAPAAGERFRQPALACTLRRLSDGGPREFYEGELAARIARGMQSAGSPLTREDLAATRVHVSPALTMPYAGGLLATLPPPTQGVTTLQIMGILARKGLGDCAHGSATYYHRLVEAVKQAFIDRDRYVADPEFADVPVTTMLSDARLRAAASRIDDGAALAWPHRFREGDTVYFAATDAAGRAVSVLQTIYFDWGSGVMAGDTGVLWHNRGAAFHPAGSAHPNALMPGKRPFHTLNPGMYLQGGRPRLLYGTQGADGQPQTLSALLTRLIDYGMAPHEALSHPRFLLGRTFSDSRDNLKLESDAGPAVFAALAELGHAVAPLPGHSPLAGQAGVIAIANDGLATGAHDPRSDGAAMAV
ncbi:gamma-glutamyltransferase family protein [Pandoraea nosoerga]|uniref:Gamma-glutamyltransferase n=1 Tax=Pandoraea nosoerga TaxID=2508296 RepID=A0A5E4XFE7_9BURK|nr:gamma-glutamyltransferase family protein [Pandoraea nosoerga]MBN4666162.1 gamma-glutamyltransferase family protein [Pandoraea nosoerga]MBN4676935.1 gamma-glutamyltransferase family protein [Pandoraea nosoerga]MBN4681604.1 gamma-glutamyltransferase family protein [Pandoraea nosoerga]MBN4745144.1 gamma-glutamyltransferase family protein [Pandoraea nosoerga]VVE35101.1 gamma-glutamyltransferase [Pandoraea nosoerga]